MLNPPLRPEDGAEFFALLERMSDGTFRASCYAQLDLRHSVVTESAEITLWDDEASAKAWLNSEAGRRGFSVYKLERMHEATIAAAATYAPGTFRVEYFERQDGGRLLQTFPMTQVSTSSYGDFRELAQRALQTYWEKDGDSLTPRVKHASGNPLPKLVRVVTDRGEEICRWSLDDEAFTR